jgi:NAD(P)H-hydrate epimerase
MTRQQVRAVDAWAINELSISPVVLMENAGRGCTDIICERFAIARGTKAAIFCGTGNNGGDGYVIARHLANAGAEPNVVICGPKDKIAGDALINLKIIEQMGIAVDVLDMKGEAIAERVRQLAPGCEIAVDAIFGTGLTGQLRPAYIELIEAINELGVQIAAVDIPSGLDCDLGTPLPTAIKAAVTITFVALKKGFTVPTAGQYTSEIYITSIGIQAPKHLGGAKHR